jgi:hypothetical protein
MYVSTKFYSQYSKDPNLFLEKIEIMKNDEKYKDVSGHKTYLVNRMKKKIERAIEIFNVS